MLLAAEFGNLINLLFDLKMSTTNTSAGTFSDSLVRCAAGTYVVNPMNGREMRRQSERRQQKRTKKTAAPKRGF